MAILTVVAGYAGLRAWGMHAAKANGKAKAYARPASIEPELAPLATVPNYIEASLPKGPTERQLGTLTVDLNPAATASGLKLVVRDGRSGIILAAQPVAQGQAELNFPNLPTGDHQLLLIHPQAAGRFSYLSQTTIEISGKASRAEIDPSLHAFAIDLQLPAKADRRPVLPLLRRRDDPNWRFCQACSATALPAADSEGIFHLPIGLLGKGSYRLDFDGFTPDAGPIEFEIPGPALPRIRGSFRNH